MWKDVKNVKSYTDECEIIGVTHFPSGLLR